jgi:hypothetical protein
LSLALHTEAAVLRCFSMSSSVSLVLALVLLWFPLWLLHAPTARLAGFDQRAWPAGRNVFLCILDALRASIGAWLLLGCLPELARVAPLGRWQDAAFLAGAVAVGLLIQTLVWRDEDHAFTPVLYLLGVAAAVAHPVVLVIALPLAIGGALALRAWSAGLLAGGLGLAGVGLAVSQQDWRRSLLVGVAFCLPVLVSVMAGRHLGWPRK